LKRIEVSDDAFDKIMLAAKIADVSVAVAVDRLVAKALAPPQQVVPHAQSPMAGTDEIAVYVVYRGQKVSGFLNLETERLRITDAPTAHLIKAYRTPSNAAVEIVRSLNPARQHPETNGWRFFNGPDDQPIDRHRRRP
jgi:hypothetical protein